MDDLETLTETERLLLMAAAVQGLGANADLSRANTARVVNQVLRWRGLSAEEISRGWLELEERSVRKKRRKGGYSEPVHEEVYNVLVRMTRQMGRVGRAPERPGEPLFEGSGNWGVPGDPKRPASWPHYNSCRLTAHGERIGQELLGRHPEYRGDV